jgi:xylulokinase
MSNDLLIGIDFGTGGCKVTLINTAGDLLDAASGEYATEHPDTGWSQQNPADWYATMCRVLRELAARPAWKSGKLVALAMDSYTHGAVLLDEHCQVIRPTIIWTDQRSVQECESLREDHFDLIFNTAYQAPTPTWTLPQFLWLKNHEPENFDRIRHISFVKDYIRYLLTGELACDCIESQGTLMWDMKKACWSQEICDLAGVDVKTLPVIVKPTDIVGKITANAAAETGLPEGLPVVAGASDSAVEDYAAGAIEPGQCILKLATAGNVNVMTADARPHRETLTYSHVVPGMWYTVTATSAAAVSQRWYRDNFCRDLIADANEQNVYERINEEAQTSPVGANGVFFHPYLMGERSPYWDANLRASFTGMAMCHTRADLSRAVLEGVAYSLRDCYRTIESMGLETSEFILIGGGARSELWSRIICDVFNKPVKCPAACDASFGSALLAGVGMGIFKNEVAAVKLCTRFERHLEPIRDNAVFYAKQFDRYRRIHDVLSDVYNEQEK